MARFYTAETSAYPVDFWNTVESIDAIRNIAHVLKQNTGQLVYGNATCSTTAGELSDGLYRRAERLEKYGE